MPKIADRVEESTTSTGTGAVTLAGAAAGFQAFSAAFSVGDAIYYVISGGAEWEVGIGTLSAGSLSRDTALSSSNGGGKVNFSAGTKRVFCAAPAARLNGSPSGYRIVLLAGQSNMQGASSTPDNVYYDTTDPNVLQWPMGPSHPRAGSITLVPDALLSYPDNTSGVTTPGSWFARHYARNVGSQVVLVPAAYGATQLHNSRWMPSLTPGAGGDLFEAAVTQANAAIAYALALNPGSYFDGFIWCQGEADGDQSFSKATYAADLTLFIQAIRARVTGAANSWALIMSMPYETMQYWAGTQAIHYAQIEVAAATPRCKFVPSTRGDTIAPGTNRHRTAIGVRKMGGLLAYAAPLAAAKLVAETLPSPIQVTGLASSAITSAGFTLTWAAAPGADNYIVEQSANSGGTWTGVTRLWGDTPSVAVSGLSASTTYLYRVTGVWTGANGTASSSLSVTTSAASDVAPSFSTQPSAQSATAGATATFTVVVTGTPTPTLQWQRNPGGNTTFANISGATAASYTTPATTVSGGSANNGDTYRCVATNTVSSVNSNAVALTVAASNVAPTITTQPTAQSVTVGATATFTAAASGTPTPTYQWQRNPGGNTTFADISGATAANYTTPATTVSGGSANDTDTYRVVASNVAGTATSNAVALTVTAASNVTYDFQADTVGAAAANTATVSGTWVVASPTIPTASYGKSLNCSVASGSGGSAITFSSTTALGAKQRATWRRGVTTTAQARDGVILRAQTAQNGSFANAKRGYWFQVGGSTSLFTLYRLDAGITALGNVALTDTNDQWFRATCDGSTLTFDSSPDGTTWTNKITVTDSTFATAAAAAQWLCIAGETSVHLDQIVFETLP